MKLEEQLDLISKYGDFKHMQQVWKFYCGLVQFDEHSDHFKTLVDHMNCGTLLKVQQEHTCDSVVESNSLSFKDKFLTPFDFTAIGYVISNLTVSCSLVLDRCTLSLEGTKTLCEKAGDNVCFHGHDRG